MGVNYTRVNTVHVQAFYNIAIIFQVCRWAIYITLTPQAWGPTIHSMVDLRYNQTKLQVHLTKSPHNHNII